MRLSSSQALARQRLDAMAQHAASLEQITKQCLGQHMGGLAMDSTDEDSSGDKSHGNTWRYIRDRTDRDAMFGDDTATDAMETEREMA